ncbi:MAG: molybdopterin-dependent oxidoreductase [Armatimonadota bacterium]|jgi:isoquinoline 1-oxidoreductase
MDHDEYMEFDFTDDIPELPMTRRDLLQLLGGGIIILFTVGDSSALAQRRGRSRPRLPDDFNAFLRIGEDGEVTGYTGKIEMGQGIVTSLAQMLADELDVALDAVHMVMGDTDLCPWDMGTFGSLTTRRFGPPLRAAGAEARRVLLELAAEQLSTPIEQLAVEDGVVFDHRSNNKRVSYAQLTKGQRIARRLDTPPPLKTPAEFKFINKPTRRNDAVAKVTGAAKYAGDIRPPEMLYAKLVRPPAHGATLTSVDVSGASTIKGARVVSDGDLIAVLHEHPDEAARALSKVKAEFDIPKPEVDHESIFDHLLKVADDGNTVADGGDLGRGEGRATQVFEETYLDGYVAHAQIEPHTAVAQIERGKATVWASTQTPFRAKDEVANALGVSSDNVRIITPFVGGGFGGKTKNQQAVEAARIAKLAGRPVQIAWTRAEAFFYDSFRPAAVVKIRSGITDEGAIAFWDYHVYFAGSRGARHFYDIPDHATVSHGGGGAHPFDTGAWRAPANNTNTFARESQIDIMAAKAGMDPVQFRLRNLADEKMRGVLKAAAEKFGWRSASKPTGRGWGVACGTDVGTSVAMIAELEADERTGAVQVTRIVCAQDMGLVVNPQGATLQVEGCSMMGLGYALTEEVRFRGGEVLDRNFGTYELPRFSWLPRIETVFVEDKNADPQGGGEPAIITVGAAVANAICDATGARVRQLPMTPRRVKEALRKSP